MLEVVGQPEELQKVGCLRISQLLLGHPALLPRSIIHVWCSCLLEVVRYSSASLPFKCLPNGLPRLIRRTSRLGSPTCRPEKLLKTI